MGKLWYLSPSSQYGNRGIGAYGTEGERMNRLMDLVVEHLERCGVDFHRADPGMTIEQTCAESDRMGAQWYFALHSNAGGNGKAWGPVAFHGGRGEAFAADLVARLLQTGQKNNRAQNVVKSLELYEIGKPKATSCLLEVDFHDSEIGVEFLLKHGQEAARAIAMAIVAADGKTWKESADGALGASAWAAEDAQEAVNLGLFAGDNGGYRWQDVVTREELAAVLMRLRRTLVK